MGVLVVAFLAESWLVYADPSHSGPLVGPALTGARAWHTHGCQACHQLYGYGGFLGPDLTNLASRAGERPLAVRLAVALATGPGGMPVIEVQPEEFEGLAAFLEAMDSTGVGQAHATGSGIPWWEYP